MKAQNKWWHRRRKWTKNHQLHSPYLPVSSPKRARGQAFVFYEIKLSAKAFRRLWSPLKFLVHSCFFSIITQKSLFSRYRIDAVQCLWSMSRRNGRVVHCVLHSPLCWGAKWDVTLLWLIWEGRKNSRPSVPLEYRSSHNTQSLWLTDLVVQLPTGGVWRRICMTFFHFFQAQSLNVKIFNL